MSRLKDLYNEQIVDAMTKKFGYKNVMEVPKLSKIVINMGVGEAKENAKLLDAAISDMEAITGQKAVTTKAKNSVANFKIREGMPIGCKVTLRGEKMYEFADRLINLASRPMGSAFLSYAMIRPPSIVNSEASIPHFLQKTHPLPILAGAVLTSAAVSPILG